MFRTAKSRVGVVVTAAMMVCLPVVGLAGPAGAAPNPNRCLSINGVSIYQSGNAYCFTQQSTGSQPNVATATGYQAEALAEVGTGQMATAVGDYSVAEASSGNRDTATALGTNSSAFAMQGDRDTATALGTNNSVFAALGSNETATALGNGNYASAGIVDHSAAFAIGGCTIYSTSGAALSCHA